jgi:hypothetical protein
MSTKTLRIKMPELTKYVKQEPYIGDDGIYWPVNDYVPEGCESSYRLLLTKELFIEAYNKWIAGDSNEAK